jgi:hypothetical protein
VIEASWGLGRYLAMHRHWREFGPPVHMAVAAYLGLAKSPARAADGDDLADFLSSLTNRSAA